MQKVHKPLSFDEIMAQTSLIGALEKNKIAYVKLNSYVKDLNGKLSESIIKMDQEAISNKQFVYDLKKELGSNTSAYKKQRQDESKPLSLSESQRKYNKNTLPELNVNETPFLKNLKFDSIKSDNSFLPVLIQNLQRQQQYSSLNLKEFVAEHVKNSRSTTLRRSMTTQESKTKNISSSQELPKTDRGHDHKLKRTSTMLSLKSINSVPGNGNGNTNAKKNHHQQEQTDQHQHQQQQQQLQQAQQQQQQQQQDGSQINQNENHLKPLRPKLPLFDDRSATILGVQLQKPKNDLFSARSIRRSRMNARELNEFYEAKMNLLKISKKFDQYRSKCTKKCEFKHPTFLNTQSLSRLTLSEDDDD